MDIKFDKKPDGLFPDTVDTLSHLYPYMFQINELYPYEMQIKEFKMGVGVEERKAKLQMFNLGYRLGKPEISDDSYDLLLDELEELILPQEFDDFRQTLLDIPGKIKHNTIIGSLNKVKAEDDSFQKWYMKHDLQHTSGVAMDKVDGASIVLRYVYGNFFSATTRGDGYQGEKQTEKFAHIVQQKLTDKNGEVVPYTGDIRCEVTLTTESFQKLKEMEPDKDHKNIRNSTVGLINNKNIYPERLALLKVIAYHIVDSDIPRYEQIIQLAQWNFSVPEIFFFQFGGLAYTNEFFVQHLKVRKAEAEYDVDGLVICPLDFVAENVYYPKLMCAFKVVDEEAETECLGIEWNVSKNGHNKPVALLSPIELNGTTVSRATCYNAAWVQHMCIGKGAVITVIKGGEIIPKVVSVIKPSHEPLITNCVSCDHPLEWHGVELTCNNLNCPAKEIKEVESFIIKMGVEGASVKSLEKWQIEDFDSLLKFRPNSKYISEMNFYDAILEKVIHGDTVDLMCALSYDGAGRKTMKKLIDMYGMLKMHTMMSEGTAPNVFPEGVGDKTFEKIRLSWERNVAFVNRILVDFRRDEGEVNKTEVEEESQINDNLKDKSFCMTGTLSMKRKEFENMITQSGGVIKSVSKKLDYLVVGESPGSKVSKADNGFTKIITEKELKAMIWS